MAQFSVSSEINKLILIVLISCCAVGSKAQQEYALHFNRKMAQSTFTNPAFLSEHKVVLSLPSIVYNYGNNAFSYNDLVKKDPLDDSTYLNIDGVIGQMRDKNQLQFQSYLDWFSLYISFKKWQFSFNVTEKIDFKFKYTKDMISLLWNGNAQYIGQEIEIGPALNFQVYKEYGFRFARHFDKFDVGLRFKLLNGLANIYSVQNSMKLSTGSVNYSSNLNTDYEIRESGLRDFEANQFLPFSNSPNKGYAFDLGAVYRLNEKWEFTASVIDLGRIKWTDSVRIHKSNGSFSFQGVDINEFISEEEFNTQAFEDSIADLYFETEEGRSYISNLVPKSYFSASFHPDAATTFGALIHMEYFDGIQPGVSIYAGRNFTDYFQMGLSYAYKNRRFDNLGLNLNIGMPAFTIYLVTDNLFNILRPGYGRNLTIRYGMNISLGKLGERKKKDNEEAEDKAEEIL
ncbi:MAG: DUF5723 family protein [Vicingaceae bacterium]